MKYIKRLASETQTAVADWESFDGPETGVGAEYWYINEKAGLEAYVCDDQGHVSFEIHDTQGTEDDAS